MTARRLALLSALLASTAEPCAAADAAARVRFPAEAPPRNDIRVDNRSRFGCATA